MTTLLLTQGDPLWTIPGGGSIVQLYGSSGVDSLALSQGAQVNFGTSFNAGNDNIYIQGDSTEFTIFRSGATVTLQDSQGTQIVVPAGIAGQQLVFGNGALELKIGSGQVMIGDQAITSGAVNLSATVDPSETSGDYFGGSGGPGSYTEVSADVGTVDGSVSLDASSDSFKFVDNASALGNVKISNFTDNDVLEISGASSGDYSFTNDGEDVAITFNNGGTMNIITLMGVVDSGDLVYNETSFEAAIGFDAFVYA